LQIVDVGRFNLRTDRCGRHRAKELAVGASRIQHDEGGLSSEGSHGYSRVSAREDVELLVDALETDYSALLPRLSRALRSHDRAAEALHVAYIRLGQGPAIGHVRNPVAYLCRMALNLAANVRLRDLKLLPVRVSVLEALADDAPSQERSVIAKQDLGRAFALLDGLPAQRREIFLARWRDGMGPVEIAHMLGLHKRTVQKELRGWRNFFAHASGIIARSGPIDLAVKVKRAWQQRDLAVTPKRTLI